MVSGGKNLEWWMIEVIKGKFASYVFVSINWTLIDFVKHLYEFRAFSAFRRLGQDIFIFGIWSLKMYFQITILYDIIEIRELLIRSNNKEKEMYLGIFLCLLIGLKFIQYFKSNSIYCNLNIECLADIINITRSKLNFRNNSNIT